MLCSQLALYSPLFCEWAWRCLQAVPVVAIPQSGFLAQVSSLRLPSGHSGQIFTLSNTARASLPSPCLLLAGAGISAASLLGELPLGTESVGFNYLFTVPPCYVALCASKARHRLGCENVSWCLETSLFKSLFLGRDSLPPYPLCPFFRLLYFFLPVFEANDLLCWVPDVLCQHSEVVLWNLLSVEMFF